MVEIHNYQWLLPSKEQNMETDKQMPTHMTLLQNKPNQVKQDPDAKEILGTHVKVHSLCLSDKSY